MVKFLDITAVGFKMNLGSWVRWSWVLSVASFAMEASCLLHERRAAPFPMSNTSSPFNTSSARDPCVDSSFQPPVYLFTDMALAKDRVYYEFWDQRWFFRTVFSFTATDIANGNRTLRCIWQTSSISDWDTGCTQVLASNASEARHLGLLNVREPWIGKDSIGNDHVGLVEYWFCKVKNGSFPDVYQSKAQAFFNASCPLPEKRGYSDGVQNVTCTLEPSQFPLRATARFQTPAIVPTNPLDPRPNPPLPKTGLSPTPSTDCTASSFAHPGWEMSSRNYQSSETIWNITSLASGAKWRCTIHLTNQLVSERPNPEYPTCVTITNETNSTLTMFFYYVPSSTDGMMSIREDWTCGDPGGMYSTDFSAIANTSVGIMTHNDPIPIKGTLIKPIALMPTAQTVPPGINTPGCGQEPESWKSTWGIQRLLYEAEQRFTGAGRQNKSPADPDIMTHMTPYSRKLELTLTNFQNNYTVSCTLDDPVLDGPASRTTWFACPPLSSGGSASLHTYPQYAIQTYILFDNDKRTIQVNQTWFCNDTGTPYQITARGGTSTGTYKFPYNQGGYNRILCGSGTNVIREVVCSTSQWVGDMVCDIFISKTWCSLDGTRDGSIAWLPPANDTFYLPDMFVPQISASQFDKRPLPPDAFTPFPSPDPLSPNFNSCTILSLGGRGPVEWTLSPTKQYKYFTSTFFPPNGNDGWRSTESLPTRLAFDLSSSVFPGPSSSNNVDRSRTASSYRVSKIGTIERIYLGSSGITHRSAPNLTLTPYLSSNWDPSAVYRSAVNMADRFRERGDNRPKINVDAGGWDFYNALEWAVRLDLRTGYVELNHSWYCDDLDVGRPIIFNGTWNGHLPLNCSFENNEYFLSGKGGYYQSSIACYLAGGDHVDGSVHVTPAVTHRQVNYTIPDLGYDFRVCDALSCGI